MSKTTQHTPSPWKDDSAIYGHDGQQICEMNSVNEQCEANARLIAAAPELLAALEDCITHDGALAWRSAEMAGKRLEAISNIARTAIAKAQ